MQKNDIANKITGFHNLNFFLVILNELPVKFVIGFGRFATILEQQLK